MRDCENSDKIVECPRNDWKTEQRFKFENITFSCKVHTGRKASCRAKMTQKKTRICALSVVEGWRMQNHWKHCSNDERNVFFSDSVSHKYMAVF